MNLQKILIRDLISDRENARKHSTKNLKAIKKSLKKFGQQKPVVISKENIVRAGNGTLQAACELGWDHLWCVISDLPLAELSAYAIADNRTGELAEWDHPVLLNQLEKLKEGSWGSLEDLGFDEDDLIDLKFKEEEPPTKKNIEGEVKFSEYIGEANNYVVLTFNNEIDWLNALTHFGLETKYARRANGKEWSAGIGRVLSGAEYLEKVGKDG